MGNLYGKYSNYRFDDILLPVIYDKIELIDNENDIYKIYKDNKVGLFYRDKILFNPKYDSVEVSGDTQYTVTLNGKYGLISQDFDNNVVKELLPVVYDKIYIEDKNSDIYYLHKGKKLYFYSKKQNKILPYSRNLP